MNFAFLIRPLGGHFSLLLMGCLVLWLTACQADPPAAEPAAAIPTVAQAAVVPSATPSLTPTPLPPTVTPLPTSTFTPTPTPTETPVVVFATATPTAAVPEGYNVALQERYGNSWWNYDLLAYHIGQGDKHVVIVGGIHGGYEWNTILLAYELLDTYDQEPALLPDDITLTIIPSANPDGQFKSTGALGRFTVDQLAENTDPGRTNGNQVDLNRNWDCNWEAVATWRNEPISGGNTPFSEVETAYLRDFLLRLRPEVVIFLHSAVPGVFPGRCNVDHQPSLRLSRLYADVSGYPLFEGGFTAYPVTGDASDYLAAQDIPSFSVEMDNHVDTEYRINLAAIEAVIAAISEAE